MSYMQGQSWVNSTQICLMKAILNSNVYSSNGTCTELQTFAFDSHSSCYTDNGYCNDILLSNISLNCLASEVFSSNNF